MAIDETKLTKGHLRKLNALRKLVGEALGEEAFGKWIAMQAEASKGDPVAVRIEEALTDLEKERKVNLGVYGYTVRRARGKGRSGFVATKNCKPE